ncbi:MAG: hypothetical protein U1E51_01980 [Candidatus Binatia bacterium]|nr:hypothetical protein [Candidatus Binatia bacterium]
MVIDLDRIDKIISELAAQVERRKIRCLERFLETGSEQDRTEAQRIKGACHALEELRRRFHALDPNCPEWVKPLLEQRELDLRPLSAPVEHPSASAGVRRRGGRA